jgi:general secretion pathway protein J
VHSAIGPNSTAGLEIVRLAEIDDQRGRILVRSRADFISSVTAEMLDAGTVEFTNPVVLIRPPFRVSFAYAGRDRLWQETWLGAQQLPEAVRITVRGMETDEVLPASTAAVININAPASCVAQPGPACGTPQAAGQPLQAPASGNGGYNAGAAAPVSAQ